MRNNSQRVCSLLDCIWKQLVLCGEEDATLEISSSGGQMFIFAGNVTLDGEALNGVADCSVYNLNERVLLIRDQNGEITRSDIRHAAEKAKNRGVDITKQSSRMTVLHCNPYRIAAVTC